MKKLLLLLVVIAAGAWYADRSGWIHIPYIGASQTGQQQAGGARGPRGARCAQSKQQPEL